MADATLGAGTLAGVLNRWNKELAGKGFGAPKAGSSAGKRDLLSYANNNSPGGRDGFEPRLERG